ncbi:MAG: hypothetical protein DHS20C13_00540 [Thermodesulfobacteriota bacterium]|nr:MAG: hypothetical protein DHS20C13_00540 [Thermodesulfobacteriota bacterium]
MISVEERVAPVLGFIVWRNGASSPDLSQEYNVCAFVDNVKDNKNSVKAKKAKTKVILLVINFMGILLFCSKPTYYEHSITIGFNNQRI